MRLIIAGSRSYDPLRLQGLITQLAGRAVDLAGLGPVSVVLSGCATGADKAGEIWGSAQSGVTVCYYPANWRELSKAAGPIRNAYMASQADALVLIWTGDPETSPGSANMLDCARKAGLAIVTATQGDVPGTFALAQIPPVEVAA